MKTLKEIAQIVLERRARMNPTVMQGEMSSVLGEEGLGEAINRRWLIPDYDTGFLTVSGNGNAVVEMQEIAALPEPVAAPDTLGESRVESLRHAHRRDVRETTLVQEIAAPGTGHGSPGFSAPPPAQSPTSAPPQANNGLANIGDDVTVVENGKAFTGKVKSNENGRYRLSFTGGERPPERDYDGKELRRLPQAMNPGQPGQPPAGQNALPPR